MRLSMTLSSYIGRNFFVAFLVAFAVFLLLILMFDIIELLRRASSKPNVSFAVVIDMALMKLPHLGQKAFPFAVMFGAMGAFWRLSRSQELVVTRAAGVSAWQFLVPVLVIAFGIGLFKIFALSPLSSQTLERFERLEAQYLSQQNSALALSDRGLWLRQATSEGQSVIHSERVRQFDNRVQLADVVVYMYEGSDYFRQRFDAEEASLQDGFWHLESVWVHSPEEPPRFEKERWVETNLTLGKIQESFASPETMSFWDLPGFIDTMEKSGFSALRHRLHLHSLMATPILTSAMILIAATFTLRRHSRRGGTTFVIGGGVLVGFLFYFFSDVIFALGLTDRIPVIMAAWTPSVVASLFGIGMLIHLEDG